MNLLPTTVSKFDKENIRSILAGDGDWFDAHLFRFLDQVLFKADSNNLARLFTMYPEQCRTLLRHYGWTDNYIDLKFLNVGIMP